jgi:hypothetical protein
LTYCGNHPSIEPNIDNITKGNLNLSRVVDVSVLYYGALALTVEGSGQK